MILQKTNIPNRSVLKTREKSFDYIDCYSSLFSTTDEEVDIIRIVQLFRSESPEWVMFLMRMRNTLVKPFGLKTSQNVMDKPDLDNDLFEVGSRQGIFKVFQKTENEIILGEDDKHLNFRVSLLLEPSFREVDNNLSITTVVKYNNRLGRFYFIPVKPFHQLIVKQTLQNIIKSIS